MVLSDKVTDTTCYWNVQPHEVFLNEKKYNECTQQCDGNRKKCHDYRRLGKIGLADYFEKKMQGKAL